MKPGDRVQVTKLRQVDGPDGQEVVSEHRLGVVTAVVDAAAIYRRKPRYTDKYRGQRKESKFPAGTKIVQVRLDGDHCARNFVESEVKSA